MCGLIMQGARGKRETTGSMGESPVGMKGRLER